MKLMEAKKINLLVFIRDYPIGLAGTKRVQQLLDYLTPKDLNIKVISCRSKNKQPAVNGVYHGVTYQNIGLETDLKLKHVFKVVRYFFKGLVATYKYRKRGQVNILYNSGGISIENIYFILWAKIIGYKLVFAIEEDYSFFNDKLKLISRFKYWTIHLLDFLSCRLASSIIVNSSHLLNKYTKLGAKRVVLIPITAKPNFDSEKTEFNNPLQIVYAGTFGDKDGVNFIIEGFELFNNKYKNAKLILLGKSEQQLIYKEKNKEHSDIVFKGFVPDQEFYSLLKESDILCMCRNGSDFANAGFPFKLGEYLATGNPVVSTKVSDVENYLTSEDAYLIDPDSPQQICSAFEEIVTHPVMARKIGLNGLQKCKDYFSQEKNGKILYDLLYQISG
jgi:glycosyltransferase involved in cell wall biosynthesis